MGTAEALRQAMQHEDRMRAQHELGGMMGPQRMAQILAMGGQDGFDNATNSGSVPHSPRQAQQQDGSPGYSPSTGPQHERKQEMQVDRQPEPMRQPEALRQAEAMRQSEVMRQPESMRHPDGVRQQPETMRQPENMRPQEESSAPSSESHYHKESGGDAVSVYPKEMVEPNLVYHKNVGGHSVSIYPKDLDPSSYPTNAAAS